MPIRALRTVLSMCYLWTPQYGCRYDNNTAGDKGSELSDYVDRIHDQLRLTLFMHGRQGGGGGGGGGGGVSTNVKLGVSVSTIGIAKSENSAYLLTQAGLL